jgi:hypothetical protein
MCRFDLAVGHAALATTDPTELARGGETGASQPCSHTRPHNIAVGTFRPPAGIRFPQPTRPGLSQTSFFDAGAALGAEVILGVGGEQICQRIREFYGHGPTIRNEATTLDCFLLPRLQLAEASWAQHASGLTDLMSGVLLCNIRQ